eukprot:494377_1
MMTRLLFEVVVFVWVGINIHVATTPPNTPLQPNAVYIDSNSIWLTWTHPFSISNITECVVKGTKTQDNNFQTIYRGIATAFNYTNLSDATSYSFGLICRNSIGWSSYSQTVIYNTNAPPHMCDTNADIIWDEIWYTNNTNTYTIIDKETNKCVLSHDGQTNPRYQIDPLCSSECAVTEATDYSEYIIKTGIKLITSKSSTEGYVIAANRNYKDNNINPINVHTILNSNDLNNLCYNKSFENTMGLLWYTQVHWPLGGIENYKNNLQRFYANGLRIFMIAYGSTSNQDINERLGSGSNENGGLTELGKLVIHELNNIGFIIDCSHCNNQTTVETALLSDMPIIANHGNVFNISQNIRTMKDDSIKSIVNKGGVVGIMPLKRFITLNNIVSIYDVLKHIDYIIINFGEDYVGISTDWYIDNVHEFSVYDYIDKYINSWKRWKYIACFLTRQPYNYTYNRIRKIMGGNFERVYRHVFDATGKPTSAPSILPTMFDMTTTNVSDIETTQMETSTDTTMVNESEVCRFAHVIYCFIVCIFYIIE